MVRVRGSEPAVAVPPLASQGASRDSAAAPFLLGADVLAKLNAPPPLGQRWPKQKAVVLAVDVIPRVFQLQPVEPRQVTA